MTKFLALVKLLFVQQYKSRPKTDDGKGKKKRAGTIALFVVIGICLLPMIISIVSAVYYLGLLSEGNVYIAGFLALVCQGLVLMFGLHAIISNVFVSKDADKLLYLPVRVHTIFLAKLTVAYLNEVITTAFFVLIALLPFGIGAGASVGYYLMLPVAIVTIPILPLFVGCVISMPLSALIAKIDKNSAVKTVLRIALYVIIMAVYIFALRSFGFMEDNSDGLNVVDNPMEYISGVLEGFVAKLQTFTPYLHPNHMIICAMLAPTFLAWLGYFAAAVGECVVLFAIVALLSLPFYKWMIAVSEQGNGGTSRKGTKEQFKVSSSGVVKQLIATDFKRVVRDSQLGFQSFAGVVMMPIIIMIFFFALGQTTENGESVLQIMSQAPLYQAIAPLVIMAYLTLLGVVTNVLGVYPISRENHNVYMLKSLPVAFSKILLAKVLFATAVMLICDTLTCVLIVILLGVKWYYGLAMLVAMALLCFGAMCITTLLDLKDPKLGWTNFNQSLKNGKNSWLAMLIGALTTVGVVLVAIWFVIWYAAAPAWYVMLLMWLFIFGVAVGFAVVSYKIMVGKAQRYFERIEV